MKKKENYIVYKFRQIAAYLMVLLFLAIPITQIVHTHEQSSDYTESGQSVFEKSVENCELCDFLSHHHGKEMHLSSPIAFKVPIVQPVKTITNLISGNYTFTLQGFTNKGPPAAIYC